MGAYRIRLRRRQPTITHSSFPRQTRALTWIDDIFDRNRVNNGAFDCRRFRSARHLAGVLLLTPAASWRDLTQDCRVIGNTGRPASRRECRYTGEETQRADGTKLCLQRRERREVTTRCHFYPCGVQVCASAGGVLRVSLFPKSKA